MSEFNQSIQVCAHATVRRWALRWSGLMGAAAITAGLVACGGGGSGANGSGGSTALGAVKVTVLDTFGAPVPLAAVQGPLGVASTDTQGASLVALAAPDATASLTVSRDGFFDKSLDGRGSPGKVNEIAVTLERIRSAAGGSLSSRSGALPSASPGGQQLTFEIELVVVSADSEPIQNLGVTDFVLRPCAPNAMTDISDCVRSAVVGHDAAYFALTPTAETFQVVAGGTVRPYAAALLLDQSGSIAQSDPTGARLFSAKAFLAGLGANDLALVAAFASGPVAIIPTPPLTTYAPFRDVTTAPTLFTVLDSLAPLPGGNTPLYESIDTTRQFVTGDASLPPGIAKALVIFTDGADTNCGSADACRAARDSTIASANAQQVRLFTIALSQTADIGALGDLANQTGGALLYADSAEQLLPLYGSVGKLLSLGLPTYRLKWTVQADAAGVFQPGSALLGRVQVRTNTGTFDVPFVVNLP